MVTETPGKWQRIKEQKGMFSILGLSPTQVEALEGMSCDRINGMYFIADRI